jgi:hypothetical protein
VQANTEPGFVNSYGMATSTDAIQWNRQATLVITRETRTGWDEILSGDMVANENILYLFMEMGIRNNNASEIWLATHNGSIP